MLNLKEFKTISDLKKLHDSYYNLDFIRFAVDPKDIDKIANILIV